MEKLNTFMAFPLLATVIWLVWALSFQITPTSLAFVWIAVLLLGLLIWVNRHLFLKSPLKARAAKIVLFLVVIWLSFFNISKNTGANNNSQNSEITWQKFSPDLVNQLREEKLPLFIDFTAAWCITCLANERVALSSPAFHQRLAQENVLYLKGDWTRRDAGITAYLESFGRSGVPLYVLYPGFGRDPVVLPQLLTPDTVSAALESIARPPA